MADSDVDLVVEGLRAEDYWQAWRLVEDIIAKRFRNHLYGDERAGGVECIFLNLTGGYGNVSDYFRDPE